MRVIGVLPALPLVVGAVLGVATSVPAPPCAWLAVVAAVAAGAAWCLSYHRTCAVLVVLAFGAAGTALAADARARALEPTLRAVLDEAVGGVRLEFLGPEGDHEPLTLRAMLIEDAGVADEYATMRAEAIALRLDGRWCAVTGGVRLTVGGDLFRDAARAWRAGRTIEAPVTFRRPARYLNHGVANFERNLALGGVALLGSVKSALVIDIVADGSWLDEWAARARARVRQAITHWVGQHSELSAAIVVAVLIGDRTGLPDEVRDRLQAAGTYHVIAISGGNIAILAGLAVGILMVGGVRGRVAAVGALVALLVYGQVVAAGPSVWRALTMAVVYLAARAMDQRTPPWQAIAVAAAVMVLVNPLDVRDAGFVLTFGATAALVESVRRSTRRSRGEDAWSRANWLVALLIASLAVELALMPVSAQLFSRVTIAGLGLNLVAVPMMAMVQIGGMAVVAADSIPAVASLAGWGGHLAAAAIVESARVVDVAPWLSRRVPPPGLAWLVAYYVSLLVGGLASRRWQKVVAATSLVVTGAVIATGWTIPPGPPERLRLTVMDVGQAEAMLLDLPGGPRLLVDSGGVPFGDGFDVGARVIAPALWTRGLRRLDGLLVTHGDPDHLGGANVLAQVFRPRWFWEGIVIAGHEPGRRVRETASATGAEVQALRAGQSFTFGEARVRVLHPPEPEWERPRVRNDDSVVLEVSYRDVAVLLTGDISAGVERAVIPHLTPAPIRILKVAHHGSRTSTSAELLEAWRPQLALISAGRGNTFGHPAPQVLDRLSAIGARVLRTDRHGQITVESDGRSLDVRSYREETER